MGFGKGLIFSLFLLMVMILLLENNPCFSEGRGKFTRDKKGFHPHDVSNAVRNIHKNDYKGIAPDIDGDEKRRVYAGPDPLHNR
ncbi:hypothetical protein OROHE_015927 [Orobanche hederae]